MAGWGGWATCICVACIFATATASGCGGRAVPTDHASTRPETRAPLDPPTEASTAVPTASTATPEARPLVPIRQPVDPPAALATGASPSHLQRWHPIEDIAQFGSLHPIDGGPLVALVDDEIRFVYADGRVLRFENPLRSYGEGIGFEGSLVIGSSDGALARLQVSPPAILWSVDDVPVESLVRGQTSFLTLDDTQVCSREPETGDVRWCVPGDGLAVAGHGLVYVAVEPDTTVAIDEATGQERFRTEGTPVLAFAGGVVLSVPTGGRVLDETGAEIVSMTQSPVDGHALADEVVLTVKDSGFSGFLQSFDASTFERRWSTPVYAHAPQLRVTRDAILVHSRVRRLAMVFDREGRRLELDERIDYDGYAQWWSPSADELVMLFGNHAFARLAQEPRRRVVRVSGRVRANGRNAGAGVVLDVGGRIAETDPQGRYAVEVTTAAEEIHLAPDMFGELGARSVDLAIPTSNVVHHDVNYEAENETDRSRPRVVQ